MNLPAAAPIDLQLHTLYSDGTWTPEQLIGHLIQEGFGAAAITDHDRVDTLESLQQLARNQGFLLLPAVEMSAHWRSEPVDVLCYGFYPRTELLNALAMDLLHRQQTNIRQTVQQIADQHGYLLPEEAVVKILGQPAVQQPHSLVALMKQYRYESATQSAGRLLLDAGLEITTLEIRLIVDAVHQSGGVCLIAHPGRGDGYVQFDETLLDQLRAEVPIDGFEVYYPLHSPEQIAMFSAYVAKHDLLTSAGSDSHTPEKPPIPYRADSSHTLLARLGIHLL